MHTQETRGEIGTGAHWLKMAISRHWRTKKPAPTSRSIGLPLNRRASHVIPRELATPTPETRLPGKGQSACMKAIWPSHPATILFRMRVMTQSDAKTMLTMPTRRQVCPSSSDGRLLPGRDDVVVRTGVDGRRP